MKMDISSFSSTCCINISKLVTYPFTFSSHIIPVSSQSHALLPFRPTSSPSAPSHTPFYLFISFNISSHLCVFSPLVLDPRGKCRVFLRKRFTFPRCQSGHRLHRPLSPHSPFPPLGKVSDFSAKTVHFPPRPAGVPAPQTSLAVLAISTLGESAGFFCENGSLSPRGPQGYRLHSRLSPHLVFPPPGKVPGFPAKTVHFSPVT